MNTNRVGLDQLIEKVKKEVQEEAVAKSDLLIKEAQSTAELIIENAKKQADSLIKEAQHFALQQKNNLSNELELASRDFYLKLNERLKTQLLFPVIKEQVRKTLKEPEFLKTVLKDLIINFVSSSNSIDVLVSKEMKSSLSAYFACATFDHIDAVSKVTLIDEEGIEGFVIIKKQDHCIWDFRAETIALELSRLLEKDLRKYFSLQPKNIPSFISEAVVSNA